jgi:hypothetical protein
MLGRLKALIPPTWYGDDNPIRDAILTGCASALSWCYSLYLYAKLQTRINTATDGWLDIAACFANAERASLSSRSSRI